MRTPCDMKNDKSICDGFLSSSSVSPQCPWAVHSMYYVNPTPGAEKQTHYVDLVLTLHAQVFGKHQLQSSVNNLCKSNLCNLFSSIFQSLLMQDST